MNNVLTAPDPALSPVAYVQFTFLIEISNSNANLPFLLSTMFGVKKSIKIPERNPIGGTDNN